MPVLKAFKIYILIPVVVSYYTSISIAFANIDFSRQSCQREINEMREIYISILRKIPAMPPLAQLSGGIQRALNHAELNRDSGDFKSCVLDMKRQISIVKSYS